MADLEAPKPCPFCGSQPKVIRLVEEPDEFEREVMVRCDECAVAVYGEYRSEALAAWNTRTAPAKNHADDRSPEGASALSTPDTPNLTEGSGVLSLAPDSDNTRSA